MLHVIQKLKQLDTNNAQLNVVKIEDIYEI